MMVELSVISVIGWAGMALFFFEELDFAEEELDFFAFDEEELSGFAELELNAMMFALSSGITSS